MHTTKCPSTFTTTFRWINELVLTAELEAPRQQSPARTVPSSARLPPTAATGTRERAASELQLAEIPALAAILPRSSEHHNEQETRLSPTNHTTHLCKYNGITNLMKTCPTPYVLPHRIWSVCIKGCRHKYTRTSKLGSHGTPRSWDERRGWPQYTRPPRVTTSSLVVLRHKVYTKLESDPKIGECWDPALLVWGRGWHPKNMPLRHVLPRQTW